jgi:O-antigen biosynthesis protein
VGTQVEPQSRVLGTRSVDAAGPAVDGKYFRFDGHRFPVRGVTYGTFARSELGLFPNLERVKRDFEAMDEANVNTVRTYTVPERPVFDLAEEVGLKLLVGVWWDDPRYLDRPTPEAWQAMAAEARAAVKQAASTYAGHPAVLGFVVGNEIPGSLVRWHGRRRVEDLLCSLHEAGKEVAPEALFGYANYPTTEYLDTSCFDFDCFNVFLENEFAYRRYLAQLQVDTGARPLVLSELGLDSASQGEQRQAEVLEWQLRGAMEHGVAGTCAFSWTDEWWVGGKKVEGWNFGLTREDRGPKEALGVVADHYEGGLLASRTNWPKVSVVVCAYQAESTIKECLQSLTRLNYPDYEVLVVDDGSTDATAELADGYPVRVISGGRLGLSGARNLGLEQATGAIVAYLDADARADEDWLTHLVVGLDPADAAGVGGPNLSPPEDPSVAQCVSRAPGGPVHVLLDNERAEHVPGCNMAFWRERLLEIGGFDPIYRAAGDDVDVCWKLQDLGYSIRFHPAALVWHHSRGRVRDFWRQQVGYGKAEALVARNHPDKFNGFGQAIWHGVIYGSASLLPGRSFIYFGRFGEAPFQRLYHERSEFRVLTGLYLVLGLLLATLFDPRLLPLPLVGIVGLLSASLAQGIRVARRDGLSPSWRLGGLIGLLSLLQPVAREAGRLRSRRLSFPLDSSLETRFPTLQPAGRRLFCAKWVQEQDRNAFLEELRDRLRAKLLQARGASAWEGTDLVCDSKLFWRARMVSYVQWDVLYLRLGYELRLRRLVFLTLAVVLAGVCATYFATGLPVAIDLWWPGLAAVAAAALVGSVLAERWLFGRRMHRALMTDHATATANPGRPDQRRTGVR